VLTARYELNLHIELRLYVVFKFSSTVLLYFDLNNRVSGINEAVR
jgi:hypothetical protein